MYSVLIPSPVQVYFHSIEREQPPLPDGTRLTVTLRAANRPLEDSGCGDSGFVVVALGVRDAGIIVDDGVHERMSK